MKNSNTFNGGVNSKIDADQGFVDAARAAGVLIRALVRDGKVHRVPTEQGKDRGVDGSYCAFSDSDGGWYQNFHSMSKPEIWFPKNHEGLSPTDRFARQEAARVASEQARLERERRFADAALDAEFDYISAGLDAADHPYVKQKNIIPFAARIGDDGCLLVPGMDIDGKIWTVQRIYAGGLKRFKGGARASGVMHPIGVLEDGFPILIGEGFATMATIHQITGMASVSAFSAGNLETVASVIRRRFPNSPIIMCSDNDHGTEGNPGVTKAALAAAAVDGGIAIPTGIDGTDFNDLRRELGSDAVVQIINEAFKKKSEEPKMIDDATVIPFAPIDSYERDLNRGLGCCDEPSKPSRTLKIVSGADLLKRPKKERKWVVNPWVPDEEVTLFSGDGGIGKSLLAIQLGVAATTGTQWFGYDARKGNTLYISCEDNEDEIQHRLTDIKRQSGVGDISGFKVISLAGEDAVIAMKGEGGLLAATELFSLIKNAVIDNDVKLLILDSAADVYGGNEIDRVQVRSFIRMLRGLALEAHCAIVLLAHPSVDGMKTGRGYSGSTAWNNSVRSRLYITKATTDDGIEEDPDVRVLELAKSNRAKAGLKSILKWKDGAFVLKTIVEAGAYTIDEKVVVEDLFVEMVEQYNKRGQRVGASTGRGYAPFEFAKDKALNPKGYGKAKFEEAMNVLLACGKITIATEGKGCRERKVLKVKDAT